MTRIRYLTKDLFVELKQLTHQPIATARLRDGPVVLPVVQHFLNHDGKTMRARVCVAASGEVWVTHIPLAFWQHLPEAQVEDALGATPATFAAPNVVCDRCGAPPAAPCMSANGYLVAPHAGRGAADARELVKAVVLVDRAERTGAITRTEAAAARFGLRERMAELVGAPKLHEFVPGRNTRDRCGTCGGRRAGGDHTT